MIDDDDCLFCVERNFEFLYDELCDVNGYFKLVQRSSLGTVNFVMFTISLLFANILTLSLRVALLYYVAYYR